MVAEAASLLTNLKWSPASGIGGGVEVPLSLGLTAGLSKKPSSSTSSTSILLLALQRLDAPKELDSGWEETEEASSSVSFVLLLLPLRGVRGSLRSLQALQGFKNLGSIATSPWGPLKMTPQHTFSLESKSESWARAFDSKLQSQFGVSKWNIRTFILKNHRLKWGFRIKVEKWKNWIYQSIGQVRILKKTVNSGWAYDFKAPLTYFVHLDISRNPDTGIDGFLCRTVCCFLLLL